MQFYNTGNLGHTQIFAGSISALESEALPKMKVLAQKLGKGFIATFPRGDCKHYGNFVMTCQNAETLKVNGHNVEVRSAFSDVSEHMGWYGRYSQVTYWFNLKIDGEDLMLPAVYQFGMQGNDERICESYDSGKPVEENILDKMPIRNQIKTSALRIFLKFPSVHKGPRSGPFVFQSLS